MAGSARASCSSCMCWVMLRDSKASGSMPADVAGRMSASFGKDCIEITCQDGTAPYQPVVRLKHSSELAKQGRVSGIGMRVEGKEMHVHEGLSLVVPVQPEGSTFGVILDFLGK
ncbi:hypothetical protein K438DRAFT_1753484 [Mycena galopus ATCC 62051]|nr:hypothetical protein K438DRAFT_1753484 [Mycena galopus ATCC 62051]